MPTQETPDTPADTPPPNDPAGSDGNDHDTASHEPPADKGKLPPTLAVVLAIALAAGILVPSIWYALVLRPQSPSDVLVASSICLFLSIVYLWVLNAISIVPFRDPWMSKAIFGAAIIAILGAAAASFKAQISSDPHPLQGAWNLTIQRDSNLCVWAGRVILAYSSAKLSYVGYSEDTSALSNTCTYGIKGIKHVEWISRTDGLELSVSNFEAAANSNHLPENQAPETLNFTMESSNSGRWTNKKADKTPSTPFIVTLVRSD